MADKGEGREASGGQKGKGCLFALIFLGVVVGGALGLHFSGVINLKKMIYPRLVEMPVVGKYFSKYLRVEPGWFLTPQERRKLELKKLAAALKKRQKELNELEQKLNQREKELEKKEKEVSLREKKLKDLKFKAEELMSQAVDLDKNYRILAKLYSEMQPGEAADVFTNLSDDIVVNILKRMDGEKAAKIISLMDPRRAADITRRMMTGKEVR
ncbi:MAG: hypothetical protein J7L41_05110 [Synergistetes bacterium]|nr:hypothetical protein [Synergistota bacterium]